MSSDEEYTNMFPVESHKHMYLRFIIYNALKEVEPDSHIELCFNRFFFHLKTINLKKLLPKGKAVPLHP